MELLVENFKFKVDHIVAIKNKGKGWGVYSFEIISTYLYSRSKLVYSIIITYRTVF